MQLRIADGRVARAARLEVQPAFFRAIGLPLVSGRAFDASETYAREGTVVVSQRLAATEGVEASAPADDALSHRTR